MENLKCVYVCVWVFMCVCVCKQRRGKGEWEKAAQKLDKRVFKRGAILFRTWPVLVSASSEVRRLRRGTPGGAGAFFWASKGGAMTQESSGRLGMANRNTGDAKMTANRRSLQRSDHPL